MTIWNPDLRSHSGPRYIAIAQCIADDVDKGRLCPGDMLPPQRDLADALGVTLGTVSRAYAEAQRRGLCRGEIGRGTFIKTSDERWDPLLTPGRDSNDIIDMGPNLPLYSEDPDLAAVLRSLSRSRDLERLTRYQPLTGTHADRQIGAKWLSSYSVCADPNHVVITAGAQHAISILLSILCKRGDTVLCEAVTYPGVKNAAALLGLKLVAVTMDDDGLRPDELERLCREHKARVLYCMSTLQNPTTTTMSAQRRSDIVRVVRRHKLQLIEDDIHYLLADDVSSPLVTLIPEQTFYVASTSKVLAGGLRVAYVLAPEAYIERLAFAVAASVWSLPPLMVALVSQLLEDGTAAATLKRKRAEAAARQLLAQRLLPMQRVKTAARSYYLWLELPPSWTSAAFVAEALNRGVAITADSTFVVAKYAGPPAVRVSLSAPQQRQQVEQGLTTLAELLAQQPATTSLMV